MNIDQAIQEVTRQPETLGDRMARLEFTVEKGFTEKTCNFPALEVANPLVDDKTFSLLAKADVVSQDTTCVIPPGRYDHCSRGKGWVRRGKGDAASWGDKVKGGYEVGPGKWVQGSGDGFNRKAGLIDWVVAHVQVGEQTWTVANS